MLHPLRLTQKHLVVAFGILLMTGCGSDSDPAGNGYETIASVLQEMERGPYDLTRQSYFTILPDGSLDHDSTDYIQNTKVYYVPQYDEGGRMFQTYEQDTVLDYLFQMADPLHIDHLIPQGNWRQYEIMRINSTELVLRSQPLGPTGNKYRLEVELKR